MVLFHSLCLIDGLILIPDGGTFSCNGATGLKPDPTDCSKFYQCAHGKATRTSCAKGTWFDPSLNNCNWIANVKESPCLDCKNKASSGSTTTFETTTTATTTTATTRKSGCGKHYNGTNMHVFNQDITN